MNRLLRLTSAAVLAVAMVSVTLGSAVGQDKANSYPIEEIANLERQIAELQQKLESLKKAPAPAPKSSAPVPTLPVEWTKAFSWRSIGPASMGGRISALAVFPSDPTTFWVGTASGGLLKTTNNGVTFKHQFDKEATVSIGDVAVAPSDKNIVWVGTGENNPRNSVSYGDGVYKSTDGGETWTNMGLRKTFQIGRIVIHPTNPDIVYVGALGRLYGPNEERGLFKTTDGGKTWNKIHYIDDKTGVIELKMHPKDPDTLLFATWERRRDGFDSHAGAIAAGSGLFGGGGEANPPLQDGYDAYDPIKKWGKGGGIWKTTDGGKTFKKLTQGLPTCETGRIGLDYCAKDPNIVYAIIDTARIGQGNVPAYLGVSSEDVEKDGGARIRSVTSGAAAEAAGLKVGDIVTSVDDKPIKKADDFSAAIQTRKPGDVLNITITREGKSISLKATLTEPPDMQVGQRRTLDFRTEEGKGGVLVKGVMPGGSSQQAGLQIDDLITAVDKQKVTQFKQLVDAFRAAKPGNKIVLTVQRGQQTKELTINVPERGTRQTPPRPYAFFYGGQRENVQERQGPDGHEYGGVYKSTDGGETWTRVNSLNPRPMYFSQIRVDPNDPQVVYVLGIRMYRSTDGGKTFRTGVDSKTHDDQHALWIDPRDSRHLLLGTDGGTYVSYDRGEKWDYLNTMSIGQFYHVCVDSRKPYRVYGGMQDNGSWGGPSMALDGNGPINADWVMVQGGDGFVCRVDPSDPDIIYTESQEGRINRTNLKTGEQVFITPRPGRGQPPYRFNWNTPMIVSSHNPQVFYCAGNYVFRSIKRGAEPKRISPEIVKTGQASATALAESPRNADVLWVGTDDGNLWVTRDGGANWVNVADKVGLPKPYWVATIEPSRAVEGRCYVCFDAHRSDNDDPWIYVTEDFGQTWKSLRGNLPTGTSRVLREDLYNPEVLYLGTEFAVWASIDRGATWTKINNNLPTVAVHELAQHPTAGEMVAATHGRGLWILDVSALRQLKPALAKADATLFVPNTATRWRRELQRGTMYGPGHREFFGENPAPGGHIYYLLTKKVANLRLEVQDFTGKRLASLTAKNEPGLHRVTWNLRGSATSVGFDALTPTGFVNAMMRGQQFAPPGQYRIVLVADKKEQVVGLRLENDPTWPATLRVAEPPETTRENRRPED